MKVNRELELMTEKFHGRKLVYAHGIYQKDEFWRIYDKKWYDGLREKCHAQNVFPDVYEKTVVRKKYQTRFFRGLSGLAEEYPEGKLRLNP